MMLYGKQFYTKTFEFFSSASFTYQKKNLTVRFDLVLLHILYQAAVSISVKHYRQKQSDVPFAISTTRIAIALETSKHNQSAVLLCIPHITFRILFNYGYNNSATENSQNMALFL